jgi:hypothetical protein
LLLKDLSAVAQRSFSLFILSPKLVDNILCHTDICLYLFPAIKLACTPVTPTHDIGVHRSVNALSASPQIRVAQLGFSKNLEFRQVNFGFAWAAMLAEITLLFGVNRYLASKTRSFLDCEHGQTALAGRWCWNKDLASMVSLQQ